MKYFLMWHLRLDNEVVAKTLRRHYEKGCVLTVFPENAEIVQKIWAGHQVSQTGHRFADLASTITSKGKRKKRKTQGLHVLNIKSATLFMYIYRTGGFCLDFISIKHIRQ